MKSRDKKGGGNSGDKEAEDKTIHTDVFLIVFTSARYSANMIVAVTGVTS